MLVLNRKIGETKTGETPEDATSWTRIEHNSSGDFCYVRVYGYNPENGTVNLAFKDDSELFFFERPERKAKSSESRA